MSKDKLKKHPMKKFESLEEFIRRIVGDHRIIKKPLKR